MVSVGYGSRMSKLSKVLTTWNVLLPGMFLALLVGTVGFGLGIGRGDALDLVAYVVAWTWVATTPFVGLAGLWFGWRDRSWLAIVLHLLAIALWIGGFFLLMLAPGLPDQRLAI